MRKMFSTAMQLAVILPAILKVFSLGTSVFYSRTFDCQGNSGCALGVPSEAQKDIKDKIRCAALCLLARNCFTFNFYTNDGLCLLFNKTPYMIISIQNCSSFDAPISRDRNPGENLSRYRRSCQSTTNRNLMSWFAVDDKFGVDAKRDGCSHTDEGDDGNNWLMVDLVHFVTIRYVRILARIMSGSHLCEFLKLFHLDFQCLRPVVRYKNLTIGVNNNSWLVKTPIPKTYPLCGIYQGPPVNASWFNITCSPSIQSARYVIVHQQRSNNANSGYLSICELQVFGRF